MVCSSAPFSPPSPQPSIRFKFQCTSSPVWTQRSTPRSFHCSRIYTRMLDNISLEFIYIYWPFLFLWKTLPISCLPGADSYYFQRYFNHNNRIKTSVLFITLLGLSQRHFLLEKIVFQDYHVSGSFFLTYHFTLISP